MGKGRGYGGGMPGGMNMNNLIKQAQKMQQQMQDAQEEIENKSYTATAGGGVVSVTLSGKKQLTDVSIKPEAVDPDDVEMLQDLIMAAVNEALRDSEKDSQATMGKITGMGGIGGSGMGGLGGGLGFGM